MYLRPLVGRDSGELFALIDDHRTELSRWLPWVHQTLAIADSKLYILSQTGLWKSGLVLGIFWHQELVGTVGFQRGNERHHRAEIGYWVAPPAQGRGLARKAIKLAITRLMSETPIYRLEARIQPDNRASLKVLKVLGFQFEGVERGGLRFGTSYRDHQVYSLLRPEFPLK